MKKYISLITLSLLFTAIIVTSCDVNKANKQEEKSINKDQAGMMHKMQHVKDNRIPLNVSAQMAQHQLMNMRNHLKSVQSILEFLSEGKYEEASKVASANLGLTKEMQMMCSAFGNEEFEKLGLEFHKSADRMSEVFKSKDINKSLEALSTTLNYCVDCHAKFKQ